VAFSGQPEHFVPPARDGRLRRGRTPCTCTVARVTGLHPLASPGTPLAARVSSV